MTGTLEHMFDGSEGGGVVLDFRAPAAGLSHLSKPVQALGEAVGVVVGQLPSELPGSQALADAAELLVLIERLRGSLLGRLADVDRRNLFTLDGASTIGTWVAQQQTSVDRGEITLARRLAALPGLEAAIKSGRLSVEVAGRVGKALAKLRPLVDRPDGLIDGQPGEAVVTAVVVDGVRQLVCQAFGGLADDDARLLGLIADLDQIAGLPVSQIGRLEAAFVVLAQHLEPAQLPHALGMLVDALLPNQLEKRAEDAHRNRRFALTRNDDGSGWRISQGDLDLECGELLDTFLRAEMATDTDNPVDTAGYEQLRADGWQTGDELPACEGPRSLPQRRHDALKLGLRRYLNSGVTGLRDKIAPHLSVVVSAEALQDAPGALPPVAASGLRLPRSLVRRWWCDSAVTRFLTSMGARVTETSHTERTLKAHERRAKHLETGGQCQGAGCRRGHGQPLIPHHVDPWAQCGTTSLGDTVLLCEQTHHDLHVGKKTLRLKDGRWLDEHGWVTRPARE